MQVQVFDLRSSRVLMILMWPLLCREEQSNNLVVDQANPNKIALKGPLMLLDAANCWELKEFTN